MPRMLTSRSTAVALALLLCAASASAQVIIVGPAAASSVPANGPMALALLMGALALAGWWQLRRGPAAQRVLGWLAVVTLGVAMHNAGLLALPLNSFTNPAGETRPIPVVPTLSGADFTGFAQEEFTNNSGATLRVTSLVPPTLGQCFTGANTADKLLQPGTPSASPTPVCQVGTVLANAAACRVDVDAICRGLLGAAPTVTGISPASGSPAGGTTVTLTGSNLANATGVSFDGVPGTSVTVVSATQVTVVTPAHAAGAVDVVVSTPAGMVRVAGGFTYAYAVGQPLQGGVIATLSGSGQPELIAATTDISSQSWGDTSFTGATSTTDGAFNTAVIIVATQPSASAAESCSHFNSGSYTDWYLPAQVQLSSLFINPSAIGGFAANTYYWSSTEMDSNLANMMSFDGAGGVSSVSGFKSLLMSVRCVRNYIP